MGQAAYVQKPVPFAFNASFIPTYFKTGMFLVEIEKVKLNKRLEPVITFKVLDSPDGKMKNARRTDNFFINSESVKGSALWKEKLTEILNSLGLREISDLAALVGQHLVMSINEAGRETLPSFRKSVDFDQTWQPKKVRDALASKSAF